MILTIFAFCFCVARWAKRISSLLAALQMVHRGVYVTLVPRLRGCLARKSISLRALVQAHTRKSILPPEADTVAGVNNMITFHQK